jgi:hypothetical protein
MGCSLDLLFSEELRLLDVLIRFQAFSDQFAAQILINSIIFQKIPEKKIFHQILCLQILTSGNSIEKNKGQSCLCRYFAITNHEKYLINFTAVAQVF